jgi:predicted metal-dependent HD superfamily phosphohydrolase
LSASGVASEVITHIEALILATRHQASPTAADEQLLVDIDLSILGAEQTNYDQYSTNIHAEYAWVPMADYCRGRTAVLEQFLARPFIYSTSWFRERYEVWARENLNREIGQLKQSELSYI